MMIDINWNNFKAKFNERESVSFERLAYFLFCAEFNLPIGIFRFKNQTGIETEPISLEDKITGFQAKYYEGKISDHKDDIIDSLKKAKSKNPLLTDIYLYVNLELSESSSKAKKKPQFLVDIETLATEININIDWRVPSHFEVQLSLPAYKFIAEYFFSLGKNIVDFLSEIKVHSENILFPIQSEIPFNEQKIKIDRRSFLKNIPNVQSAVTIIGGDGGSGKTALIKDLFSQTDKPIYIFKAAEFNINAINDLFKRFGEFTINDFLQAHEREIDKIVVIDSAEKLADLENQDAFKEFLAALIKSSWKIIFTTRQSYFDDLGFQLVEIYRLPFSVVKVENLTDDELKQLAESYNINLPGDEKLFRLIHNLFYLDEYLAHYNKIDSTTDISKFRDILWQKKIQNSKYKKNNIHLERERCFLQLAKIRCETGHFYVKSDTLNHEALALLASDEIIQFDQNQGGYFITHDIYEEWALEKIIDREFLALTSYNEFFSNIGTSLAIRRAFRNWLSVKLSVNIDLVKPFIENVFIDATIQQFWKDELLVSVLLSDYSEDFFTVFESILLENERANLKKVVFLLRTACKEVDRFFYGMSNLSDDNSLEHSYLITKPKGKGWQFAIVFIHKNIEKLKVEDLEYILPLLKEWNSNNRSGDATRAAALFALHFYKKKDEDEVGYYRHKTKESLLPIIYTGSMTIQKEMTEILDGLLSASLNDRHAAFQDIVNDILGAKDECFQLTAVFPEYILKLADKYWYQPIAERHEFDYGGIGVEQYYLIPSRWHHEYFPASTYQTPIYWTLQYKFPETIEFVIKFTNRAIQSYVDSDFDESVREIEVYIDAETTTKQYISSGLWNTFRGNSSPVTPYLLQSYHMALEKYLLNITKTTDKQIIKSWLMHLLKKTKSASITAVVASVVIAFKEDFFDVAAILFRNYEFLQLDSWRRVQEDQAKSLYSIGVGFNQQHKIHEKDRLDSVKDAHRATALENLALQYQFFNIGNVNEEEFAIRQQVIWDIIDEHYKKLELKNEFDKEDQTHRLLLARIDRRKMKPTVEVNEDDNYIISFNPEIEPELKKHSEEVMNDRIDLWKYSALKLWTSNKFTSGTPGNYPQYDDNPTLILAETKEIVKGLKKGEQTFYLFNHATPAFACFVLIRDFSAQLSEDEKLYCRDTILGYATAPLQENYDYQISDGVEVAIHALPFLYELFPDDKKNFDIIFLLILFDTYPIGEYKRICDYAIEAINQNLYTIAPDHAIQIFQGYLAFKQKFEEINTPSHLKQPRTFGYRKSRSAVLEEFTTKYDSELQKFIEHRLVFENLKPDMPISILETAFQLIPIDSTTEIHLNFVKASIPKFTLLLKEEPRSKRAEKIDYKLRHRFFERFAHFILHRDIGTIKDWVQPFVDDFVVSDESANFLQEFISAEDKLQKYDAFWITWECFYDVIKKVSSVRGAYRLSQVISNYLLAWRWWKETAKTWFSLKEREKLFYTKVTNDMGSNPTVLYSIAKLVNEVGAGFINDSIGWIATMLSNNKNLYTDDLETNTIYYLEVLVRKYVYLNRTKLKGDRHLKNKLLTILEFLIQKASVNAYLLREDIL